MKRLFYLWLLLTIVGATVMGFVEKPRAQQAITLDAPNFTFYETSDEPRFVPIACVKGRPCFIQSLRMVSPNTGREYEGCIVSGNEMLITPCTISVNDAVKQRSEQ